MDELEQFSLLLDSGLDNVSMIQLSFKEHEKIIQALSQGDSLIGLLSSQKGKTFETISLLTKYLPLKDSLQCVSQLDQAGSSLISKLLKECVYPSFMFLFSYFMILFFSHVLLPAMQEYTDASSTWMMSFLEILFSGILLFIFCVFLFRNRFMDRLLFIKRFTTIRFAILLEALLHISLPTSQALEILSQYPSIQKISLPMYQQLQKGKTFMEILQSISIMDPGFIPLFQIGLETNVSKLLNIYIQKTTHVLSKEIKRFSIGVQILAYSSVGLMVLFVYQIMLMPLNMLNSI